MKATTTLDGSEQRIQNALRRMDAEQVEVLKMLFHFYETHGVNRYRVSQLGANVTPSQEALLKRYDAGLDQEVNILRALKGEPVEVWK